MIRKYIVSLVISLIIIALSVSAFAKMVSVAGDNVNLRSGPGTKYSIKWKYGSGFPLKVLEEQGSWLKVEDFEGDTGWLYKNLTSTDGHMIVKVNKNQNQKINIRSGPGTTYKIVGKAYYGVVFKTIKQQNGWAHVKHDSGLEGWVERSLLWGF
ncbi:MAG: SH3 domain-containing protein [Desulfofustis sp.]|jgi:SH3-like domain-containing protein|nr:SH3 domain-containing protein [Desulfofustis sp.]